MAGNAAKFCFQGMAVGSPLALPSNRLVLNLYLQHNMSSSVLLGF